jgi:hypothetical protein
MEARMGHEMVRVGREAETVVATSRDTVLAAITNCQAALHQGRAGTEATLMAALVVLANRNHRAIRNGSISTILASNQARAANLSSQAQMERRLVQSIRNQDNTLAALEGRLVAIVVGQGDSMRQRVEVLQAALLRESAVQGDRIMQTVGS